MQQSNEIKIKPAAPFSMGLSEIWHGRELLYFFVWRDVKVKYKQTYLGILWAILQPVMLMLIFYFIFFRTLNITVGMHYPHLCIFRPHTLGALFVGYHQQQRKPAK